jgi:hypothetical protein
LNNLSFRIHSAYICIEFGPRLKAGLKGKPVLIPALSRSCKERELAMGNGEIHEVFTIHYSPFTLLNLHTTVAKNQREGVQLKPSQKTCQVSYLIIHGFRAKGMECKR